MSNGRFALGGSIIALVAIGIAAIVGGTGAAAGMGLGVVFTAFSILTTWFLIKISSSAAEKKTTPVILVGLLFLFKLPLLGVCVFVAVKLGLAALAAFLTGVILVYFALIWRVQTVHKLPDRSL